MTRRRRAVERCDAVITSGGVSVGDFDYVSAALERIVADDRERRSGVDWYQVAIKPAKPLCFGWLQGTPRVRAPRQPGVVVRELRAVRTTGAAQDDGPRPHVSGPRSRATAADAMPRRIDGKLHLDRVVVEVVDGRYVADRACAPGEQRARRHRRRQCACPAARRRGRRRRRRHHRHVARLTRPRRSRPLTPSPPARRAEPALA